MRRGRTVACALLISSTQSETRGVTQTRMLHVNEFGIRYGDDPESLIIVWEALRRLQIHRSREGCQMIEVDYGYAEDDLKTEQFTFDDEVLCSNLWKEIQRGGKQRYLELQRERQLKEQEQEKRIQNAEWWVNVDGLSKTFFILVILSVLAWVVFTNI